MSGAAMNYDFGQKRHWRRWVWNRIAERVRQPHEALVLYLAGAADKDRPLARTKGFRDENLIAIERDGAALQVLRSNGVLTIEADFFRAIDAVAISSPANASGVQVINADMCGGLSLPIFNNVCKWIGYPNLRDCVFAINMLRGRDARINPIRNLMQVDLGKHRGKILVNWVFSQIAGANEDIEVLRRGACPERVVARYHRLINNAAPVYTSYRSTAHQTFDTVVFRNPMNANQPLTLDLPMMMKRAGLMAEPDFIAARRSTSAVLAHRTMRKAAQ